MANRKICMLVPSKESEKGIAFYSNDLLESITKSKLKIEKVEYERANFLSLLKTISKLKNFDLIHIQHENRLFGPIDGIWFMPFILLLGILKKGKIIMTFHNIHTKNEKLFSLHPILNYVKRWFTHPLNYIFANFFTSYFIVHTNFLKNDLIKNSQIKPSKIKVIPQGVKRRKNIINKKLAKKKLNLSGNVYLLTGNMGPNKGFDIIVRQAKKIKGIILIAGNNKDYGIKKDYLEEMKRFAKKNKLENVRFDMKEGINAENNLWWLYFSAADLVILSYRMMTTSGIFIDSMSAGKPIVGCNSRYFREISKKYGCVKIAQNEENYPRAIKEAMKILEEMEREAKRFAKDNNIILIGKDYKNLYNSLLNK